MASRKKPADGENLPAVRKGTTVGHTSSWRDELAKEARVAKQMEAHVGTSNAFSTKNGKLVYNDQQIPNNEMIVIILDYILENAYYTKPFKADDPTSPACFAFGTEESKLAPHEKSQEPQSEDCASCEWNKFGSANVGRGKACRNVRRLALMPGGKFTRDGDIEKFEDPDYFMNAEIATLKIPPTSLKGWAAYVREVAGLYDVPPAGVYTHIKLVDDDADQFHINFAHAGPVSDDVLDVIMKRRKTVRDSEMLVQPYVVIEDEDKGSKRGKAQSKGAAARGKGRGRY